MEGEGDAPAGTRGRGPAVARVIAPGETGAAAAQAAPRRVAAVAKTWVAREDATSHEAALGW